MKARTPKAPFVPSDHYNETSSRVPPRKQNQPPPMHEAKLQPRSTEGSHAFIGTGKESGNLEVFSPQKTTPFIV
ncbi:hypothetical protein FKM82_003543 [Ascaphus truei]